MAEYEELQAQITVIEDMMVSRTRKYRDRALGKAEITNRQLRLARSTQNFARHARSHQLLLAR
jgi:hypothetical protein